MRIFTKTEIEKEDKFENFNEYPKDYSLMYAEALGTSKAIQNILNSDKGFKVMNMYSESPVSFFASMFKYLKKAGGMILSLINKVISLLFGKELFDASSKVSGAGKVAYNKIINVGVESLTKGSKEAYDDFKKGVKDEVVDNVLKNTLEAEDEDIRSLFNALLSKSTDIDVSQWQKKISLDNNEKVKSSIYDELDQNHMENKNRYNLIQDISEKLENELIHDNENLDKSLEKIYNKSSRNTIQRDYNKNYTKKDLFSDYSLVKNKEKFFEVLEGSVKSMYIDFYDELSVLQIENMEHVLYLNNGEFDSTILNVVGVVTNKLSDLNDKYLMFSEWLRKLTVNEEFRDYDELKNIVKSLKVFNQDLDGLLNNYEDIDDITKETLDDVSPNEPETFPKYISGTEISTLRELFKTDRNLDNYYDNSGHPFYINKNTKKMIPLYEQFNFSDQDEMNINNFKNELDDLKENISGLMNRMDNVLKTNTEESDFINKEDKEQLNNIEPLLAISYNLISFVLSFHSITVQQLKSAHLQEYLFKDILVNVAVAIIVKAFKDTVEEDLQGGE